MEGKAADMRRTKGREERRTYKKEEKFPVEEKGGRGSWRLTVIVSFVWLRFVALKEKKLIFALLRE